MHYKITAFVYGEPVGSFTLFAASASLETIEANVPQMLNDAGIIFENFGVERVPSPNKECSQPAT